MVVSSRTGTQPKKLFPDHLPSILHGVLVVAGSLWLPQRPFSILRCLGTGPATWGMGKWETRKSPEQGLFFQFCDVAEVTIIHKDDLARFGYRLDMKVEKN